MSLIAGLLLPAGAVWLAMRAANLDRVVPSRVVAAALAVCGGLGAAALTTFWLVSLGVPMGTPFLLADVAIWAAIGSLAWWRRTRAAHGRAMPPRPAVSVVPRLSRLGWLAPGLFVVSAAIAARAVAAAYLVLPHGDWDAWAIWNQKARFLFRAGANWTDALAIDWSHPGHPLLVPLSVARLWAYAGAEMTLAPALIGIVFGAAIVAVVVGALDLRRPRAWIAGALLLAPVTFVQQWTAQQADIPFAFFMVACLVVLVQTRTATISNRSALRAPLFMAGALGGLAAWTKNEGALLLVVATFVAAAVVARKGRVTDLAWWVAGAIPAVITVGWLKLVIAPTVASYLPDTPLPTLISDGLPGSDHRAIVDAALWRHWLAWGGPLLVGAAPTITLAALCVALTRAGRTARQILAVPLTMLASYYVVYLLTPLDVTWLIATTFDRLLVQLWPSFVLAAFYVVHAEPQPPPPQSHPA